MWTPHQDPDPGNKISHSHYIILSLTDIFLKMTQYDWQLLCAKHCGKTYTIKFFWGNGFLLDCNHSLANSYYIMRSNVWVGLMCGGGDGLGWSGFI